MGKIRKTEKFPDSGATLKPEVIRTGKGGAGPTSKSMKEVGRNLARAQYQKGARGR